MAGRNWCTWMLAGVFVATLGGSGAAEEFTESPISEVLATPVNERDGSHTFKVRGVLTMVHRHANVAVIQDATGSLWLTGGRHNAQLQKIALPGAEGTEVVVQGRLLRGGYTPVLVVSASRSIRNAKLPVPVEADFEELFLGMNNGLRVVSEGVVQAWNGDEEQVTILLACQSRRIWVHVLDAANLPAGESILDSRVRVVGVVGSVRNTRGEFLAPHLVCSRRSDIVVVALPPTLPFQEPIVPLTAVGRYRYGPVSAHRITTEGVVTYASDQLLFVQEGLRGVRVRTMIRPAVAPGDRVRITGFIEKSRLIAGIDGAIVEQVGAASLPEPLAITPDKVAAINRAAVMGHTMADPSDCDGCLVTFPATVIEAKESGNAGELVLTAGGSTVVAQLGKQAFREIRDLLPGSSLQITGVLQVHFADDDGAVRANATPRLERMSLYVRDAGDVKVLLRPSWWTPGRLAVLLGSTLLGLAGMLIWAWLLRREVASQGRMLTHEMRLRRDSAVEFAASTRERNRLAANLHDTLLQTLRGIDFQLGACRAFQDRPDQDPVGHLDVACKMVNHAAEELRDSVWALRTMPLAGRSFQESLEAVARQTGHGHTEHVTVRVEGTPFDLPHFVAGNLLLVAQEAIHNAIRHADAASVDVRAVFSADQGEIVIHVADDGSGFILGEQVGPDQGHFGIVGMRERTDRLGGELEIASHQGTGTLITIHVRKRHYDALIDVDAEDMLFVDVKG